MIKRYLLSSISLLLILIASGQEDPCDEISLPFKCSPSHITVYDGAGYEPVFIKGMNLGVAVPGTSPGELAATTEEYLRWMEEIHDAGFNAIRLYTLHYPRFYQAFHQFNTEHPNNPLHLLAGIWLEEELPGYNHDLYTLADTFDLNAQIAVDAIHGNVTVPARFGKAFGTYDVDVSQWVMAFIIGREVYPYEIRTTNENNPSRTSYSGTFLSVASAEPATRWVAERMDKVIKYENDTYQTQRPLSFSSWPTLDPIDHTYIPNVSYPDEDSASVDLTKIDYSAAPAGIFASFHAYPYYPPFVSTEPDYLDAVDAYGPNSYLAYIQELRDYHAGMPTMIAEFGTPSSWGVASYAHSNMHHGGLTEEQVGIYAIRMFENMQSSNMAGGCYFAWIDEWFKRTWITDKYDFPLVARQRWHNKMSAEQNFGLVEYVQTGIDPQPFTFLGVAEPVSDIDMAAGYAYLYSDLHLNQPIGQDTLWIGIDSYDAAIGESILPNGDTVNNRVEFALMITETEAKMYVTLSYDPYGIYFGFENKAIYKEGQQYRSTVTNGGDWEILTWRNDELDTTAIQIVGNLNVNRPSEILSCVSVSDTLVSLKLPWNLLNFVDPSQLTVLHDNIDTPADIETRSSDGIAMSISYKGRLLQPSARFTWETWDTPGTDIAERKKDSYFYVKDNLKSIDNPTATRCDFYLVNQDSVLSVPSTAGVLSNDFALDPNITISAQLINDALNGDLELLNTGGFTYTPDSGFVGQDEFTYRLIASNGDRGLQRAYIYVSDSLVNPPNPPNPPGPNPTDTTQSDENVVIVYPNPADTWISVSTEKTVEYVELRNNLGQIVYQFQGAPGDGRLDISGVESGMYWLVTYSDEPEIYSKKVFILHP